MAEPFLSGVERRLADNEIIVSKTDLQGRITYCNDEFLRLAGYRESELLGAPHSIIRHPAMPRCVFKLLWDTLAAGDEIFAYVVNRSQNGDHYWVFAHVTPDRDEAGAAVGYHSNRRSVTASAIAVVEPLYRQLLEEEARHSDRKSGMAASYAMLVNLLTEKGMTYEQLVLSL